MLFHVSEEPDIKRFEPRLSEIAGESVVWAIDAAHIRNYLLPRDCPRVTYYPGPQTTSSDRERFLGSSDAVVAIESDWYDRMRSCQLFCYHLPPDKFACFDSCAGYFVSRVPVVPSRVEQIDDLIAELLKRGVELRFMPSLWPLRDAVVASTLQFSIIRMRNSQPGISDISSTSHIL
jgi:uncharacterized protein DUF6886